MAPTPVIRGKDEPRPHGPVPELGKIGYNACQRTSGGGESARSLPLPEPWHASPPQGRGPGGRSRGPPPGPPTVPKRSLTKPRAGRSSLVKNRVRTGRPGCPGGRSMRAKKVVQNVYTGAVVIRLRASRNVPAFHGSVSAARGIVSPPSGARSATLGASSAVPGSGSAAHGEFSRPTELSPQRADWLRAL
jgi:hypothetical protein